MAAAKGLRLDNPGDPVLVFLILASAVSFVAMLVFNALAGNPSLSGGLFIHGIGNVSAQYPLQITPAGWAFSIWGVIYLFQAAWIVYAVVNICRKVDGGPAYTTPEMLTPAFFCVFLVNNASNVAWLFLWDREALLAAVPVLVVTATTCQAGLLIGYSSLYKNATEMMNSGRMAELTFIRVFVFNGLGMYGAWTTIASLINVGTVLAYVLTVPLPQDVTAIVCLAMLAILFFIFIVLDLTVLKRFSFYTFTPYLVLLWALVAIMSKNWDPEQTASIMVAVLSGVGAVGLVLKLVTSFWFQRTDSLGKYKPMN